jgi:hypothetical protein
VRKKRAAKGRGLKGCFSCLWLLRRPLTSLPSKYFWDYTKQAFSGVIGHPTADPRNVQSRRVIPFSPPSGSYAERANPLISVIVRGKNEEAEIKIRLRGRTRPGAIATKVSHCNRHDIAAFVDGQILNLISASSAQGFVMAVSEQRTHIFGQF